MSMVVAGCIGAVGSIASGIFGSSAAKRREREAAKQAAALKLELTKLENSRQAIINPYANAKDLSTMAKDVSSMASNPFASLGVATKAAEMQIEEADISLANTLDVLRETGNSAGGATALAQAALKSKQGVTANIEQQEAQNEKLRAQGEQQLEQIKISEAQRIQGVQISEGQRMQQADAAGQTFMFNTREDREQQKLDRTAGQLGVQQQRQAQAAADRSTAWTSAIGGVASSLGAMAQGGAFGKK